MSKAKRYYNLIDVEPKGYISQIGSHRFGLTFQTKRPHHGKSAAVIQMNGSKADPFEEKKGWKCDSTIGKVLCWCYENPDDPYEIVHCLNLFSIVDPHPENLTGLSIETLNKTGNDDWIRDVCDKVDCISFPSDDSGSYCDAMDMDQLKQVYETIEVFKNQGIDIEIPVKVLTFTGLRNEGICSLRVKDINFNENLIVYMSIIVNK